MSRIRFYKTAKAIVPINPDPDVLDRYLTGGDRAFGLHQRRSRKGGGSKPSGIGAMRVCEPPQDGWKGCNHSGSAREIQK